MRPRFCQRRQRSHPTVHGRVRWNCLRGRALTIRPAIPKTPQAPRAWPDITRGAVQRYGLCPFCFSGGRPQPAPPESASQPPQPRLAYRPQCPQIDKRALRSHSVDRQKSAEGFEHCDASAISASISLPAPTIAIMPPIPVAGHRYRPRRLRPATQQIVHIG
jgi:hypothetical protein